jgi:transcriptional regulator with XRE-family HTH domain
MTTQGLGQELADISTAMFRQDATPKQTAVVRKTHLARAIEASGTPETANANTPRARALFKEPSESDWVDLFDRNPSVLHAILGDIFRVVKSDEAKQRGEGRDGRRTKVINGSLRELEAMITPRYSQEPFGEAVKDLIGSRSLRQFAAKVPMDHRELSRLMRGQSKLSVYYLERIAAAGKVHPAFFTEWREQFVISAVQRAFRSRPNMSITAVKQLRSSIELGLAGPRSR